MKKAMVALFALCMLFCSVAVFAEAAPAEYVVQSVTGKVEREVSAGKFEAVTEGSKLALTTVINTGLNSSLVVKAGDKVVTIKALQKGSLDILAGSGASKGIKLGAKAATTDVTADGGQTRTNVSTASTRASDATKDIEWQTE
jgi:hypothetical protein